MNFEKIPPLEDSKFLLDVAFKRARERKDEKKFKGKPIDRAKNKELIKLDLISAYLMQRLDKAIKIYPSFEHLPKFYIKLMDLTLDIDKLKLALGSLSWAKQNIHKFHKLYVRKICKAQVYEHVKDFQKQFYGRVSSIMKQIDKDINHINQARRTMKTYPDIKEDFFTICLYGFPNIGKTTLLNKLTGTKAKTAAYEFTTKSINVGYLTADKEDNLKPAKLGEARTKSRELRSKLKQKKHQGDLVVQVCDVPGTLARPDKMNIIELQAELVKNELAQIIIYLFDLTQYHIIQQQIKLHKNLTKQAKKTKTPVITIFSKQDIVDKDEIEDFKDEHDIKDTSLEDLKQTILEKGKNFYKNLEIRKEKEAKAEELAQATSS